MRIVRLAVLIAALIPAAFLYAPKPPASFDQAVRRVNLAPVLRDADVGGDLGPFTLAGAWQLESKHANFGNFSALVHDRSGLLIALGDKGGIMRFTPPDRPDRWYSRIGRLVSGLRRNRLITADAESAALDPASGRMLVAYEGEPAMFDYPLKRTLPMQIPLPVLREWPDNQGPEAMTRLADGRTIVLGEVYSGWFDRRTHPGLLFAGQPQPGENPARFEIVMPEGYRPVDLAQMPDGRVLVLGRTLSARGFRTTIALFDPAQLRAGARLTTRLIATIGDERIRENYEGMTAMRDADGGTAVWLISDSNEMVWAQRTLLLKLRLKPGA